jgi:teichoic acid transport system ATP-binding protein
MAESKDVYSIGSEAPVEPDLIAPPDVAPGTPVTVAVEDLVVIYKITAGGRQVSGKDKSAIKRGKAQDVVALKGVTFALHHGQTVGVVGGNGSGKSTLLRAIGGLTPAAAGRVYTNSQASLLGVHSALLPGLSGRENIELGCLAMGLTPREIEERYEGIVEFSGLEQFIDLPMNTYSSGMGARLRFAISTAARPKIMMVDEALAVGDTKFREKSRQRIEDMRGDAGTVILVSHNMADIQDMCQRAIWIDRGRLRADGPVEQVVEMYQAQQRR